MRGDFKTLTWKNVFNITPSCTDRLIVCSKKSLQFVLVSVHSLEARAWTSASWMDQLQIRMKEVFSKFSVPTKNMGWKKLPSSSDRRFIAARGGTLLPRKNYGLTYEQDAPWQKILAVPGRCWLGMGRVLCFVFRAVCDIWHHTVVRNAVYFVVKRF